MARSSENSDFRKRCPSKIWQKQLVSGLTPSETMRKVVRILRTAECMPVSQKSSEFPQNLHNENDDFVVAAAERYGYSGKKQAMKLVEEMGGLFAGGELSDDDIDGVMKALQDYYWKAKEDNKKYTPKKYRGSSESK